MRNASALESLGSAEISWSMFQISSHLPQKKRGVNFSARPTGSDATSSRFRFPGDLGSSCRSWDHGRHPDCHKEEQPRLVPWKKPREQSASARISVL